MAIFMINYIELILLSIISLLTLIYFLEKTFKYCYIYIYIFKIKAETNIIYLKYTT